MSILGLGAKQSAPVIMQAPNPPTPTDPNVVAAADAARQAQAQAAGRASTILTSGSGDTSQAMIGRKTALGQ